MDFHITASCVSAPNRLGFLPNHFGVYMLKVQSNVHHYLLTQCHDYHECPWDFYELSNQGAYLVPHLAYYTDSEPLLVKYTQLLEYVAYHPQAFKICAAIDSIKH